MESDPFYEALPFTLPQQQADPQYVILGTGLQQCLIAAFRSKMNLQRGLVIDLDKTYGSCLKTLTFKELHSLSTNQSSQRLYSFATPQKWRQVNQKFFENIMEKKQHRGYNLDIQPNIFFAWSVTCQFLKQAEMDKYMDFRLIYNMLYIDKGKFCEVPLSKGKIFSTKTLTLIQKKLLLGILHDIIKIYNKYNHIEQDQNSTNQFDKNFGQVDEKLYSEFIDNLQKPFIDVLKKKTKNNKKIINYLTYIICNYQYNYEKQIPCHLIKDYSLKGFLNKFGKFVKSCGIYGEGPYLYVDNGIGDIPQAYSRIASIFGTTYILHPKISLKISQNQDKMEIHTNLMPNRPIKTKKIYYGPTFYDQKEQNKQNYFTQNLLRVVFLCQKIGSEEECPSIAYLLDTQGFENPIYLFLFDENSHTCPKGYIFYQFETIIQKEKQSYEDEINKLIKVCVQARGQKFEPSIKYVTSYIRKRLYPDEQKSKSTQKEVFLNDNCGIDLDNHFTNFKSIVGQHEKYFKKENPNQPEEDQDNYFAEDTGSLLNRLHQLKIPDQGQGKSQQQEKNQNIQSIQKVQKIDKLQKPSQKQAQEPFQNEPEQQYQNTA